MCEREKVNVSYYHIGFDFKPAELIELEEDEWIYIVNYYGQLDNGYIYRLSRKYNRIIVDNTNAYFQKAMQHIDTIYTCRKWFGVADGSFLYTDSMLNEQLKYDESYDRMRFVLGRYERGANEFYEEFRANEERLDSEPIKKMSKLTWNLLHAIDYDKVKQSRHNNFDFLHKQLKYKNKLELYDAFFMYPLYVENGEDIRIKLREKNIYVPTLWPHVLNITGSKDVENRMARNILPLPIDQRYNNVEMESMISIIDSLL